jgi:hypothetical protein
MRSLGISQRRRAVISAIVASASVAGVTFAAPALAVHFEKYIEVPQCQPATSEDCPQTPEVPYTTYQMNGDVHAQFTANANHCSDISVRFSRDGYGPMSDWMRVGPGQTVSATFRTGGTGNHTLIVAARGILGGCNTKGVLSAWGGTVGIDTDPVLPTRREKPPFGQPDDPGILAPPH